MTGPSRLGPSRRSRLRDGPGRFPERYEASLSLTINYVRASTSATRTSPTFATRGAREELAALAERAAERAAQVEARRRPQLEAERPSWTPGAATWAAENEGAWTDTTATAASEVPPNLALEDTVAWINGGMARWN